MAKTIRKRSAVAFEKKLDEMIAEAKVEAASALVKIDEAAQIHIIAASKVETLEATQAALAATAGEDEAGNA